MQTQEILTQNANGYFWYLLSHEKGYCQFDVLWQDCLTGQKLINPIYSPQCTTNIPCLFSSDTLKSRKRNKCPNCSANWTTLIKDSMLESIAQSLKNTGKQSIFIRFKDSSWTVLTKPLCYKPFDWVVLTSNQNTNNFEHKSIKKTLRNKILTLSSNDQNCLCAIYQGKTYITEYDQDEATQISFIYKGQKITNWIAVSILKGVFVGYSSGLILFSELQHQKITEGVYEISFGIEQKQCKQICLSGDDLWVNDGSVVKQYNNFLYSFKQCIKHKDLRGQLLVNQTGSTVSLYPENNDLIVITLSGQEYEIQIGEYLKLENYGIVYSEEKIYLFSHKESKTSLEICLDPPGIRRTKTKIGKPLSVLRLCELIGLYIDENLQLKQFLLKY